MSDSKGDSTQCPSTSDGPTESQKVGCTCWCEIPVVDMDRAQKFYSTVFDWTYSNPPGHTEGDPVYYCVFSKPDIPLFGGGFRKVDKDNHVTASKIPNTTVANRICFAVASISKALEAIKEAGGDAADPCMGIGEGMGYSAAFVDSEGNVNSIWSMKE